MSDLRKAAQQALEALEAGPDVDPIFAGESEAALRAALAQEPEPVQEPVAVPWQGGLTNDELLREWSFRLPGVTPTDRELSAFAIGIETGYKVVWMQRPPLTDEEMLDIIDDAMEGGSLLDVARAIERKVRGE